MTTESATSTTQSDETITTIVEDDPPTDDINHSNDPQDTPATATDIVVDPLNSSTCDSTTASPSSVTPDNDESPVCMVSTACGDYHNLALDTAGQAYSLPSPLHFSSFPGGAQQRVSQVVCGKVRCVM